MKGRRAHSPFIPVEWRVENTISREARWLKEDGGGVKNGGKRGEEGLWKIGESTMRNGTAGKKRRIRMMSSCSTRAIDGQYSFGTTRDFCN